MLGYRSAVLSLIVVLSGCVRVLNLGTTDSKVDDTNDTDTDLPNPDTAGTTCIAGTSTNFKLPSARWGLAALHAERRFADVENSELRLPAHWFLASAWQMTNFGCADYGAPWSLDEQAQGNEGCLKLHEETIWNELCRLHPQLFECDSYAGAFTGDSPEASIFAMTWFQGAAHAMLSRFQDPNLFYATATDPLAREQIAALMHFNGPWTPELQNILENCGDDIIACVSGEYVLRHMNGLAENLTELDGADCYEGPLTGDDISAYSQALASLWPDEDWASANTAASEALTGGGFQADAERVLDAYDNTLSIQLRCPEKELWDWYTFSCP